MLNDTASIVILWGRQCQRLGTKRRSFLAVYDHIDDEIAVVHLQEVESFEVWLELFGQDRSIIGRDTKRDHGADVAKDRIAHGIAHL